MPLAIVCDYVQNQIIPECEMPTKTVSHCVSTPNKVNHIHPEFSEQMEWMGNTMCRNETNSNNFGMHFWMDCTKKRKSWTVKMTCISIVCNCGFSIIAVIEHMMFPVLGARNTWFHDHTIVLLIEDRYVFEWNSTAKAILQYRPSAIWLPAKNAK